MAMSETKSEGGEMPKGFLEMWSLPKQADPELRRRLEAELRDPEADPGDNLEDGRKDDDGR